MKQPLGKVEFNRNSGTKSAQILVFYTQVKVTGLFRKLQDEEFHRTG
jgi:hypothetical protein